MSEKEITKRVKESVVRFHCVNRLIDVYNSHLDLIIDIPFTYSSRAGRLYVDSTLESGIIDSISTELHSKCFRYNL